MTFILIFIVVLFSVSFHEVAHGFTAFLLGDPTAKNQGRLTLNPVKHIDLFGTVILPLILLLSSKLTGGIIPVFGYAKPVSVNHLNFKSPRFGRAVTALAGPLSNILLAFLATFLLIVFKPETQIVVVFLFSFIQVNLFLAVLNLIPIPPLDGSRIVSWLLPGSLSRQYDQMGRFGFLILILVLQTSFPSWLYEKGLIFFMTLVKVVLRLDT